MLSRRRMSPLPSSSREDGKEYPEESGSAIAEFLLVALPLFIPALILFIATNRSGQVQFNQTLLARQALAAFTFAADDSQGQMRIRAMLDSYVRSDSRLRNISYQLDCESRPCIRPGAAVEIELTTEFSISGMTGRQRQEISNRARGFVDKWRE